MSDWDDQDETYDDPVGSTTVISGKWVVMAMFAFGILATAILWTYWKVRTEPYLPLQNAIAAEFPESRPRVEGGSFKGGPAILRIVAKVDFDPETDDIEVDNMVNQLSRLAHQHQDLSEYSAIEFHLFWAQPENRLHQRTITRDL